MNDAKKPFGVGCLNFPFFPSAAVTARLAYFMGLEILSDCVGPHEDADLDLVNAIAVLRKVFAGESQTGREREPNRRFRVKFLPSK